ncbi:hypothetical protein HYU13_05825 [Candidatus Woesearchaeota archaeon]|nr:hypothetical protein [Candidatus Woesearchaeota archaeon]
MDECNEICKDCIRFKKFGKSCWVYWEGKKQCTFRATREDEFLAMPMQT